MPPLILTPQRPTIPFNQWNLDTARGVMAVPEWLETNRLFYIGDHWQHGEGWVGPFPAIGEEGALEAVAEIYRGFTSKNLVKEIVDRRRDGVIGREPSFNIVPRRPAGANRKPSDAQLRDLETIYAFLTPWWDARGLHEILQRFVGTFLWGERASLRAVIPAGLLGRGTIQGTTQIVRILQASTAEEALSRLFIEQPDPKDATVYVNPETRQQVGVYLYNTEGLERAELTYIEEPSGLTAVRQVGGGLADLPMRLGLGRRLMHHEEQHPRFITEQVRELQRALNLALTMVPRNIVSGGFLEMVVLNGMMPGHWKKNDRGERIEFVPSPLYRGPAITNWIQGIERGQTKDGIQEYTNPSVSWRPPSPVTPVMEAGDALEEAILASANQLHVRLNKESALSGRSRDSSRHEFGMSLRPPRTRTQRAGRWMVETAIGLVDYLTGTRYLEEYRCDFQCFPSVGPVTVEERAQDAQDVEAGRLSLEAALERGGVEDAVGEISRIEGSRHGRLALSAKEAASVAQWKLTGLGFLAACEAAGIDDTRAKKLWARRHEAETAADAPEQPTQ